MWNRSVGASYNAQFSYLSQAHHYGCISQAGFLYNDIEARRWLVKMFMHTSVQEMLSLDMSKPHAVLQHLQQDSLAGQGAHSM